MKPKILLQAALPAPLIAELQQRYQLIDYQTLTAADFAAMAADFQLLLTNGEATVTRELIAALPNLALIAVFGVGYDGVDVVAAREHQVAVTHTPGVLTDDVADLAMGLMLATSRQIVAAQQFIQQGGWAQGGYPWTRKVSGSRLGIVGLGRIGMAVAKRAQGFDMSIAYCNRTPLADAPWHYQPDLLTLAQQSDYLLLCTPGGASTRHLINRPVLDALGKQGTLINISRGSVVDQQALIAALDEGTLGAAGLDVFDDEPRVPEALQNRANVVITPHIASATWSTRQAMSQRVLDNVRAYFAGHPLVTPIP
ncbi:2-hydroxyacid dehydrogenase [Winslowiella iniecta]|uniref:Hydroxyacid dehydrogenase n=2 Tax=Winslowiella iniecta TaxID=1560201 RepID=A0A0L7SZ74_9GAMM|nr:2-hydroxyacid dehydrogenase [Winslowiella iniecta]KOC88350.1 hydroxyacid dehydrogenase [Winslowiella iniecta]